MVLMFHIWCWSLDVTWWYSIKSHVSEKYVFCSVLILLWPPRLSRLKMLFHGNSLAVPFGTPFFRTLWLWNSCSALLSWNKNIIIPRCEKVIKKPVAPEAAIEDTTTNLLSFIKTQEIVGIFFLQLDLLLPRFL